jgi:hypothetical protein
VALPLLRPPRAAQPPERGRARDRLLDAITSVGVSEAVTQRLRAEEAELVEMRGKLTALAHSGSPKRLPAIDVEALVADLRSSGPSRRKDPVAARDALHRMVESVVLKPVGDEYEATLAFRNSTATIAGGRVGANGSCGGRI